jgi:hypothetical protein
VELVLSSLIFAEIRELITEVIKVLDELLKFLLLGVRTVDEVEILLLQVIEV